MIPDSPYSLSLPFQTFGFRSNKENKGRKERSKEEEKRKEDKKEGNHVWSRILSSIVLLYQVAPTAPSILFPSDTYARV